MPTPVLLILKLVWSFLLGQKRSFRQDALLAMHSLHPPVLILGSENIPAIGPCLITANHYWHPDFRAWWLALAISAAVPAEMHWIVTFGLRSPGLLGPLSRWAFPRGAVMWGFTSMPPIPPDPTEVEARARAVRLALEYARRTPAPLIGLAPEGHDLPGGALGVPPSGVGRFILLLSEYCPQIVPVGVFFATRTDQPSSTAQASKRLCVRFGPPYRLALPQGLNAAGRDRLASDTVMRHIAAQLPSNLHGAYPLESQ